MPGKLNATTKFKFKVQLVVLVIITALLLFFSSYWIMNNSIEEMKKEIISKFVSMEYTINSEFSSAKQTIYAGQSHEEFFN